MLSNVHCVVMISLQIANIQAIYLFISLFFSFVFCNVPNNEKLYWRSYLPNDQFLSLHGLTISDCVLECKLRPDCSSINYKVLINMCEINDISAPLWKRRDPGIVFAMRTDWGEDPSTFCDPACSNGERCDTETRTCHKKECGTPPIVSYTDIYGNSRTVGSKVQYKCTTDTVTAHTSVCLDTGTWSPVPACPIVDCGNPSSVLNSFLLPGSTFEGHSRQYQCDPGYGPDPTTDVTTMTITCQGSGDWTPTNFQCIISCDEPSPKPNAHVLSGGTTMGSTRQYNCNDQYVLNDASDPTTMVVTCQSTGVWTLTNFQCVADCLAPSPVTGVEIPSGSTIFGSVRVLQCRTGYRAEDFAVSTVSITCQESGAWSTPDDAFRCLKECATEPSSKPNTHISPGPSSGVLNVEGDVRTYQCLNGYGRTTGSDNGEVTCQSDGSWTESSIICVVDCGAPSSVSNSTWSGTTTEGSVVTYTCNDRYELSPTGSDSTVTCQASGTWTDIVFTCEVASLGMDCPNDSDCLEENSRCVNNNYSGRLRCLCNYHTEYNEATRSCETRCDSYSDSFTKIDNMYINKFNHAEFRHTSLDNCMQNCIDRGQDCASFDYWSRQRRCYLNKVTYQQILDGDQTQLIDSNEFDIYTRDCTMG